MKEIKRVDRWECDEIRKDLKAGKDWSGELPYVEMIAATGRAACRQCGEKIAKGEQSIHFPYSFTDGSYNPWTAFDCQIHLENCSD